MLTPPGIGGEIQLTDTLSLLVDEGHALFACQYEGERFDTGRPIGLLKASLSLALRRDDIGPGLKDYLASLQATGN